MSQNEHKNEVSTENFFTKEEVVALVAAILTIKAAAEKKGNNVSIIKTDCLVTVISKALALWDTRPSAGHSSEVLSGQLYVLNLGPQAQNKSSTRIVQINRSFFNDLLKIFNDLLFVAYLATINCLDKNPAEAGVIEPNYGEWIKKYIRDAVSQRKCQEKFLETYERVRMALEETLFPMLEKPRE